MVRDPFEDPGELKARLGAILTLGDVRVTSVSCASGQYAASPYGQAPS